MSANFDISIVKIESDSEPELTELSKAEWEELFPKPAPVTIEIDPASPKAKSPKSKKTTKAKSPKVKLNAKRLNKPNVIIDDGEKFPPTEFDIWATNNFGPEWEATYNPSELLKVFLARKEENTGVSHSHQPWENDTAFRKWAEELQGAEWFKQATQEEVHELEQLYRDTMKEHDRVVAEQKKRWEELQMENAKKKVAEEPPAKKRCFGGILERFFN